MKLYIIEKTHKTQFNNTTKTEMKIFKTKEEANREIKLDKYKFSGNSTGSVSYDIREENTCEKATEAKKLLSQMLSWSDRIGSDEIYHIKEVIAMLND